ncbi:ATP-binding cassette domain-containing protein [Rickettsiales bacterium LUAb2]
MTKNGNSKSNSNNHNQDINDKINNTDVKDQAVNNSKINDQEALQSEEVDLEKEELAKESSKYIKASFFKILSLFNKTVAEETLFSNLDMSTNFSISHTVKAAKNAGLVAEMRRINIFDIHTGTCILMQKHGATLVLIDGTKVYDPKTEVIVDLDREAINQEYTGYAVFFYEVDLKISSFVKRTGFLFRSISSFKTIFLEILVLSFLINIFGIIVPFYSLNVYDRIIPNNAMSSLLVLSLAMVIIYIFDAIFKSIKTYASEFVSNSIGQEIDQQLFNKLLNMKAPGIPMSNGAKMSLFKELQMVREFYFSRFIPMLIDIPFLLLSVLVLMFISPLIALVPVILALIVFIVNVLLQVPLQNTHANMMTQEQNRSAFLTERINNIETIKTFNGYGKALSKWLRISDGSYTTNFKYLNWVTAASNFSVLMMNLNYIFTVVVGVFEISNNVMTSGALIAASTLGSRVMTPIVGFSGMIVRYRSIQNVLKHLEKVIEHPSEDESQISSKKGPFTGKIEFRNISFFYPGLKQPILSRCNFVINPGERVGIIGRTGAGKSTITKLLLGLDFANEGQVLFDDIDSNDINISELRSSIGYLPQKSQFFQGSIKENILLSNKEVSESEYKKLCKIAGIDLIIERTGLGDDMMINEQGTNISGGQQQIVALARAIINDPPILILDEPTTGMDTTLESSFMKHLDEYSKDKTLLLITHKAAQLSLVDRVILIEQGRVLVDDKKDKVLNLLLRN